MISCYSKLIARSNSPMSLFQAIQTVTWKKAVSKTFPAILCGIGFDCNTPAGYDTTMPLVASEKRVHLKTCPGTVRLDSHCCFFSLE